MNFFSTLMLLIAISFLYYVIRSINKNSFLFSNAALWLVVGIVLILFSLFPSIPNFLATLFGFQLTSNFLLFLAVFLLILLTFTQSIQLSKQKMQITTLIQELSMMRSKEKEQSKDDE